MFQIFVGELDLEGVFIQVDALQTTSVFLFVPEAEGRPPVDRQREPEDCLSADRPVRG